MNNWRCMMAALLFVLLTSCSLPWREYSLACGGLSVLIPGVPAEEWEKKATPRGEILVRHAKTRARRVPWPFGSERSFYVSCYTLPNHDASGVDQNAILDAEVGAFAALPGAVVISQRGLSERNLRGREITVLVAGDHVRFMWVARVIIIGKTIVTLAAGTADSQDAAKEFSTFFSSLKLKP